MPALPPRARSAGRGRNGRQPAARSIPLTFPARSRTSTPTFRSASRSPRGDIATRRRLALAASAGFCVACAGARRFDRRRRDHEQRHARSAPPRPSRQQPCRPATGDTRCLTVAARQDLLEVFDDGRDTPYAHCACLNFSPARATPETAGSALAPPGSRQQSSPNASAPAPHARRASAPLAEYVPCARRRRRIPTPATRAGQTPSHGPAARQASARTAVGAPPGQAATDSRAYSLRHAFGQTVRTNQHEILSYTPESAPARNSERADVISPIRGWPWGA